MRIYTPLLAALVAGCTAEIPAACEPDEAPVSDVDQDGYVTEDDCNDDNELIHPGAFEKCNDIDDDCDGSIDEDYTGDCEALEICNGLDDDDDGVIDEGFEDLDGDGLADCLDDACDVALPGEGIVPIDDECLEPDIIVTDPWDAGIEWQYTGDAFDNSTYVMPAIGHLQDTDGDGDIDTDDVPNIVYVSIGGYLVVLEGDTGAVYWRQSGFGYSGSVSIADVDSDGVSEIVAYSLNKQPRVVEADGTIKWTASVADTLSYPISTVADLDGDGDVEIISSYLILDGTTGSLVRNLGTTSLSGIPYTMPAIGDIDLDGIQEVVLGHDVYDPTTGTIEWSGTVSGSYGHWNSIVDVDGDPEGEVIMIGSSSMVVYDDDGSVLYSVSTSSVSRPGPPCVADFDGDGTVEIAWASGSVFGVYELNGTRNWSATVNDSSGLAGCSGYDVNGDGAYEVLFADQDTLWMFDGVTGRVNYSQPGHNSGTVFEYPTVADVDQDGSAEIVFVSNYWSGSWGVVTVLGHNGDGWPAAGTAWGVHDFAVTNINEDGSIPTAPRPWQVHNVYRSRPAVDTATSNLLVEIVDVCVSSCDPAVGVATVSVQVRNEGASDIRGSVPIALYADNGGVLTLLDVIVVTDVGAGVANAAVTFDVPVSSLGDDGLVVRVDDDGAGDDGAVTECDESDNADLWPYDVCP